MSNINHTGFAIERDPLYPTGDPEVDRRSMAQIRGDLAALERRLEIRSRQARAPGPVERAMARSLRARSRGIRTTGRGTRTTGRGTRTTGDNTTVAAPGLKPVTTLVSMLPKTTYNEVNDAEGTVKNTPAYVKVQLQLLDYLGKQASDTLTPRQACHWTEKIADNKQPQAKDALRLCYYMRSQGFDTYADIRNGFVSLYIGNQVPAVRGPRTDLLYWKQNHKTNAIEHITSEAYSAAQEARRNAFAPSVATRQDIEQLLAGLDASERAIVQHGHGEDAGEYIGPVSDDNHSEEDGQPTQDTLVVLLASASADLEALLASDTPDTAAVEAALAQLEQYQSQVQAQRS